MNKNEFLITLKKTIKKLPRNEKEDILNEYTDHFLSGIENGQSEEDISDELGDPKRIGRELCFVSAIDNVTKQKNTKNLISVFIAISSLSILNLFVISSVLFTTLLFSPIIISLIIIIPVLLLLPFILLIIGFIYGFDYITFIDIVKAVIGVLIGILLSLLVYLAIKTVSDLFMKYLNWNVAIINKK
ncbi:hypothetical protein A9958_13470 (plasmid) [Staphylococcus simulans]|uniref:HAAS signaling domain-containing protein n=1 Tax=Staphylococcus simulans TaxID=1286 RepID=UPI000D204730|nr:DUF1700 domain-containing protein [Staphylococcus simulans]AVO03437.1 hypothetical protein BI282_13465 [Staphylococcus simulans]AVO06300.1 hypothetical protein BI283_12920 [Staphylococcus simulans]AWG19986.1 hypothetical protein A9958_13470 [Staphylococcus simulans]AWI02870.1 hypothetical protein A7X73_13005 [Staphylococcus simulans]